MKDYKKEIKQLEKGLKKRDEELKKLRKEKTELYYIYKNLVIKEESYAMAMEKLLKKIEGNKNA